MQWTSTAGTKVIERRRFFWAYQLSFTDGAVRWRTFIFSWKSSKVIQTTKYRLMLIYCSFCCITVGVDIFKALKICANYLVYMINNIGAEVAKIISVLTRGIYQRGVSVPYINSAALARHWTEFEMGFQCNVTLSCSPPSSNENINWYILVRHEFFFGNVQSDGPVKKLT